MFVKGFVAIVSGSLLLGNCGRGGWAPYASFPAPKGNAALVVWRIPGIADDGVKATLEAGSAREVIAPHEWIPLLVHTSWNNDGTQFAVLICNDLSGNLVVGQTLNGKRLEVARTITMLEAGLKKDYKDENPVEPVLDWACSFAGKKAFDRRRRK